jgi:hypothetical protein
MNRKTWIHIVLYIGCMTLLLLQGYRIKEMRREQEQQNASETIARQMLDAIQKALLLSNERCGWNKSAENVYGHPQHPSLKEQ